MKTILPLILLAFMVGGCQPTGAQLAAGVKLDNGVVGADSDQIDADLIKLAQFVQPSGQAAFNAVSADNKKLKTDNVTQGKASDALAADDAAKTAKVTAYDNDWFGGKGHRFAIAAVLILVGILIIVIVLHVGAATLTGGASEVLSGIAHFLGGLIPAGGWANWFASWTAAKKTTAALATSQATQASAAVGAAQLVAQATDGEDLPTDVTKISEVPAPVMALIASHPAAASAPTQAAAVSAVAAAPPSPVVAGEKPVQTSGYIAPPVAAYPPGGVNSATAPTIP